MSQSKPRKAMLAAPTSVKMVAASAPVTITASAEGATGAPMFAATAYSGSIVSGATATPILSHDYIIDLSGMTQTRSVKANLDHRTEQRVGHATSVVNDGKEVKVAGLLSAATAHRDEVAHSAAGGYEWEVSIEGQLTRPRKLAAGKTETVNGRTVSGPLYIFGKSVLTALAFVSRGADEGNNVTIAATAAEGKTMNEFEKFAASLGVDLEVATNEVKAKLQEAFDAVHKPQPAAASSAFAQQAAQLKAKQERRSEIEEFGLKMMAENPLYRDDIERLTQTAADGNTDVRDFKLELVTLGRITAGTISNRIDEKAKDNPKVIEAALCLASGLPNIEKHYSEQVLDAVDRSGLRHISLQQVLMQHAAAGGYRCRAGERITTGNLRSVLRACFSEGTEARLGFSAATLPNILGNVANKQILAGYMEEDPTWKEVSQVKSVSNFYTQNYYRMLDSLEYEEVGSGGEIKHGTLGEEMYTAKAKTYGKMLGLTRTQIINDDLGAFDDIRARLGRGAAKKFNNVFWTAFMDNSAFFTSALTNYISGNTTNLGTDGVGLALGVKACRTMTSPSADGTKRVGNGFVPSVLLVPPELENIAEVLYRNQNLGAVGSSTANIYANRYRPVVQNRLSESAFTGYSTTAWYLIGTDMKPMLVTFLNGQQTPTVESTDADFDTLGIQFRGYHDFGCDKSEYLSAVKSKGAA